MARPRVERPAPAPSVTEKIVYTQTRQLDLSEKALRDRRVVAAGKDGAADAFRLLRTQVLRRMRARNANALAITSPSSGDGKTLTAVNLAISIAKEVNHTILLGDLDLRRPDVHNYFSYQPTFGISDYLLSDTPITEILFNPGIERLVVLPGRQPLSNSSELLSSPRMVQLVEDMKKRYPSRFVLFDLPPVLSADDVLAFSPYVDAVLLIVQDAKTRRDDLQRAVELLRDTYLIGTVLNQSQTGTELHTYH